MEDKTIRIDDIGFGGYRLVQNPRWFCYGVDAVLIADFAKMKKGAKAADLGTGTGMILLYRRAASGLIPEAKIRADHIGCEYGEYC